jgi:hypothetical protein
VWKYIAKYTKMLQIFYIIEAKPAVSITFLYSCLCSFWLDRVWCGPILAICLYRSSITTFDPADQRGTKNPPVLKTSQLADLINSPKPIDYYTYLLYNIYIRLERYLINSTVKVNKIYSTKSIDYFIGLLYNIYRK